MHIAVLDDNIADRKQTERLLDRESDRRIHTTGNLYVDSFGAIDALFVAPRQYDFFLISWEEVPDEPVRIIERIRANELDAPVCVLNKNDNVKKELYPEGTLFLDKPIKVADLTDTIEKVLDILGMNVDPAEEEKEEEEKENEEPGDAPEEKEGFFKKLFKKK